MENARDLSVGSIGDGDGDDTVYYTPPETLKGFRYTRHSDVWCIGKLLSNMVSGSFSMIDDGDYEKGLHKCPSLIGEKSAKFLALLDGVLAPAPAARISINEIIKEHLAPEVKSHIESQDFKDAFLKTRELMILFNDEN